MDLTAQPGICANWRASRRCRFHGCNPGERSRLGAGGDLQAAQPEDRAFRNVGATLDLPAVGEDNLLHYRESKPRAFGVGREVRFEDLASVLRRNAGAV